MSFVQQLRQTGMLPTRASAMSGARCAWLLLRILATGSPGPAWPGRAQRLVLGQAQPPTRISDEPRSGPGRLGDRGWRHGGRAAQDHHHGNRPHNAALMPGNPRAFIGWSALPPPVHEPRSMGAPALPRSPSSPVNFYIHIDWPRGGSSEVWTARTSVATVQGLVTRFANPKRAISRLVY